MAQWEMVGRQAVLAATDTEDEARTALDDDDFEARATHRKAKKNLT